MDAAALTTEALTRPNPPLLGALSGLLARAHRTARRPAGWTGSPADRDLERLLADLRALPGVRADLPYRAGA